MVFNTDTPVRPDRVPPNLRRATVLQPAQSPSITVTSFGFAYDAPLLEVDTLRQTLHILPKNKKWACRHVVMSDDGALVAQAIQAQQALAVSDGSLKYGIGTAAFTVVSAISPTLHPVLGALLVPGVVKDGDSHCCELAGLYGIVTLVHCVVEQYSIPSGGVHVACNNEQALHVFDPDFLLDPQQANYDLVNALFYLLHASPLKWTCKHVKGQSPRY